MSHPTAPTGPDTAAAHTPSSVIVQKYGGSSVADVPRIHSVARRVVASVRAGHQVVVVVSAMGNTTNELLALARSVSATPGRRELDLLVSVGERVSMTLLAMAIADLGVPASSFTGSQSGIITDTNHVAARVEEVRPHRIRRALDQGHVAIVAGFQGVSRHGEVTTLGRGGSDTTAVVLAAALNADWCELCSDVDGVFSADPRIVDGARRLDLLPLDAAVALSRAGAKVLHAQAVELARNLGVQLHAASTARPSGSGTRLPPGPPPAEPVGVTMDTALIELIVPDLSVLEGLDDAVRHIRPHGSALALLVDTRNLPESHHQAAGRPVATVTAVGRHLVTHPRTTHRALSAIQVPIERWWTDAAALHVQLDRAHAADLVRAFHIALVETSH
jgi:aspartokinase